MKKNILLVCLLLICTVIYSQVPQAFNYQAVARGASGNILANKVLSVKISLTDSIGITTYYSELQQLSTNAFGLFSCLVGKPTAVLSGNLSASFTNGKTWMKVEVDTTGVASNYINMGSQQLTSVPFALYAGSSGSGSPTGNAGGSLSGTYPNPIIANNAIDSNKIKAGSIAASDLAAGVIPTTLLPSGLAGGSLDGTYPNPSIANNAIDSTKIKAGSIAASDLAVGVIPTTFSPTGNAGGNLSGSYPNPTVAQIQNIGVSSIAPLSGQILKYNGTEWAATNDSSKLQWGTKGNDIFNANAGNVGIGVYSGAQTPIGKLDVIGSGAGVTTNSFVIRNFNGDTLLRMRDDNRLVIGYNGSINGRTLNFGGTGVNFFNGLKNGVFGGAVFPTDTSLILWSNNGANNYLILQPSWGNVGIGTYRPTEKLHVNGNMRVNGSLVAGINCTASGGYSTVIGQNSTASGNYSTAMGNTASTNGHTNSFCIGGGSSASNPSVANDSDYQMMMYFDTYKFWTGTGGTGVVLPHNGNAWKTICDKRKKENFLPLNGEEILKKISPMQFTSWNYKHTDAVKDRHYGIMAQDFYGAFGKDAFGTIGNDTTVNPIDMIGIDMVAIQALEKRTSLLQSQNSKLIEENSALKIELKRLSDSMEELKQQFKEFIHKSK